MKDLALRLAGEGDAALILNLLQTAFEEYRTRLNPPSGVHRESRESIREKMSAAQWLIAEMTGEPVGCVMYQALDGYIYLGRLAVLPAFRGRGIANALIECVEAVARAEGLKTVRLGVRLALPQLREAYERRGYWVVEYKTHDGFSEPTYVLLEKELT